jgi:hypothetical protein
MIPSTAIVRYDLSPPMEEFDLAADRLNFIGHRIYRPMSVGIQAANLGKVKLEQLLQNVETERAPGGGYHGDDFEMDIYSYSCQEHGAEAPVDDALLAIFRDIIDIDAISSARALDKVLRRYERAVAAKLYDEAVFTGSLTNACGSNWSDHDNAKPIDDIHKGVEGVVTNGGMQPNAVVMNTLQYFHLCNCAQIVDRVKYTETATQDEVRSKVADCIGLKYVLVAGALQNTANPQQARSISRIWGNSTAAVCRVAETDDPEEPCIGRTMMWDGDGPGAVGSDEPIAVIMEEYRDEKVRGSRFRARNNRDIVTIYSQASNRLTNVLAS